MGLSFRQIGRELKRSDHTIKKLLSVPAVVAEVRTKKAELSDMFERLAIRTIEAVSADDIKNASLQQKAVSSGIFIDKMQLLRDQPTANINVSALLEVAGLLRDQRPQRRRRAGRAMARGARAPTRSHELTGAPHCVCRYDISGGSRPTPKPIGASCPPTAAFQRHSWRDSHRRAAFAGKIEQVGGRNVRQAKSLGGTGWPGKGGFPRWQFWWQFGFNSGASPCASLRT